MKHRRLVLVAGLLMVLVAAGGYIAYSRYMVPSGARVLVGRWEGTGWTTSKGHIEVKPGPGVPGGKESLNFRMNSRVQAEFRSDGTYTWDDKLEGDGLTLHIEFPKAGEAAPGWQFVPDGPRSGTLKLHNADFTITLRGPDTFVLRHNATETASELTFQRKP